MPTAALAPKNTSRGPSSIASFICSDGPTASSKIGLASIGVILPGADSAAPVLGAERARTLGCCFMLDLETRDGTGEVLCIEGLEVVQPLADANGIDGKLEPLGYGHENAAPGGAVELGHHEARHARDLLEDLHL